MQNKEMVSVHLDSVVEVGDGNCPSKSKKNRTLYRGFMKMEENKDSWFGPTCNSFKEIMNMCMSGDHSLYKEHLLPKIKELEDVKVEDSLHQTRAVKRRKIKCSLGDEIDIHKVYQGNLENAWTKSIRDEFDSKHHLVTFFVNYGGNSSESAVSSLWGAATLVKLCQESLRAGKSVQIICASISIGSFKKSDKLLSESICIKRYNENLNIERIAATSHLGAFRSIGFSSRCCADLDLQDSLGASREFTDSTLPLHLQEEIKLGHTRLIQVPAIRNAQQARDAIAAARGQMAS